MSDSFDYAVQVCRSVSALEAGRALGLDPNHDGRCACPFHSGRDRNMKLYHGDRGYYCFVCHEKGDVIALVQGVLGVTFQEAVQWLSDAFHLGVDIHTRPSREAVQRAKKQARIRRELNELHRATDERAFDVYLDAADLCRYIDRVIEDRAPEPEDDEWDEAFCTALKVRTEAREILGGAEELVRNSERGSRN